jgi:hypothetical protein
MSNSAYIWAPFITPYKKRKLYLHHTFRNAYDLVIIFCNTGYAH